MIPLREIFDNDLFSEQDIRSQIEEYEIHELIDQWDTLNPDEKFTIFKYLDHTEKTDFLLELPVPDQEQLFQVFNGKQIDQLLGDLQPDDLVDIIQTVSEDVKKLLWEKLSDEAKRETLYLMRFDEDDAAGIMNPRYMAVSDRINVGQAMAFIRKNAADVESIYNIYVIDKKQVLVGVCSLKELLSANDAELVRSIMEDEFISVREDTDQEDVAKILETYDLVSLPVVDAGNVLLGIITFDDVIDVIREEQTEDVYKMGAMGGGSNRYLDTTVWGLVKKRIPWLIILLILGTISTNVVAHYDLVFRNALLATTFLMVFMPVITQTGGNSGSQSSTLMIRGLATGEIHFRDFWTVIFKELKVGLIIGLITGLVIFGRSILFPPNIAITHSIIVGIALGCVVVFSTLIGALAPLLIHRLGFDPTVMSGPLMSTVIDVCGLTIYFEIAWHMFKLISG
ncbi:MAG: magnesium transporter [Spirochaetales bacterium]|nr:magnesium transporter [Spirochaetales bacterium]